MFRSLEMNTAHTNTRVSVIIPAYNCAAYLPEAIESALAQTHGNVEIIVINDGSPDNTDEVVAPYLSQVKYIKQENRGLSAARNVGFRASAGEFVCFLDADDLLLPEKFDLQLAKFKAEPDLGIVISGYIRVGEDGRTQLGTVRKHWHRDALDHLLNHEVFPPHAALIRRGVLEKSDLFPEGIDTYESQEDLHLWLDLALNKVEFSSVPESTCQYRERLGSISSNAMKHFDGARRVVEWLEHDPRTNGMRDRVSRFAAIIEAGRLARAINSGQLTEAKQAFARGLQCSPDYWYLPSTWSKIYRIAFAQPRNGSVIGRKEFFNFEQELILNWIPKIVATEQQAFEIQGVAYCALTDEAYATGEKKTARYAVARAFKRYKLALKHREVLKSLARGVLGRHLGYFFSFRQGLA